MRRPCWPSLLRLQLEAVEFVRTLQHRQGLQVACLEEIAYPQGFIGKDQLIARGKLFAKTAYGQNLLKLAQEEEAALLARSPRDWRTNENLSFGLYEGTYPRERRGGSHGRLARSLPQPQRFRTTTLDLFASAMTRVRPSPK